MTIAVEEVVTDSPAVKAYRVVLTDSAESRQPKAPQPELVGIGKSVFEQLERERK